MLKPPRFSRSDVEILDDEVLHRGFYSFRRLRLKHRFYAGGWSEPVTRELFEQHDAAGILLFDPQRDTVALVEQFRIGALGHADAASPWLLELVAGLIDTDESPEDVARREAEEEAGAIVSSVEHIASYYSSPGGSTEYFHLYCGRADLGDAGGVFGLAEENEDIQLHLLSASDCFAALDNSELTNAHVIIALQWLRQQRERLQREWC